MDKNLSVKQRRSLLGKAGKKKSPWRYGFGEPLSPNDTTWADRVTQWQKENAKK